MANKFPPTELLQHTARQDFARQLDPERGLTDDKFLQNAQDFIADAYLGRDITRPRDLYTFLSLGRVPTNLRSRDLKSRSVNADSRRVTFGTDEVIPRRNSFEGIPSTSYFKFDLEEIGLEPLPPISASGSRPVSKDASLDSSKPVTPYQHIVAEELAGDILSSRVPFSLIKGYHKVNLSTTWIFAPDERLDETVKYNKKVVLPKIKTSESDRTEIVPPSVLTLDSVHAVDTTHDKKFQVVNVISPRKKANTEQPSHPFGVRPECFFINAQLGERNPLLKENVAKSSMASNVPRVVPGLHDLKDWAGYPKEYWKLRAEKISQPADLEADMIDRDLYRLRQLSTLKLNSIERTFQAKNDPFKKWRGKGGEPLFSPGQQRVPYRRRRYKFGPTALSETFGKLSTRYDTLNPPVAVKITPLKITTNETIQEEDEGEGEDKDNKDKIPKQDLLEAAPNLKINLGGLNTSETKTTLGNDGGSAKTQTPRDIVDASLDTYRKLQAEREDGAATLGTITAQKQHELKKRRENNKQALKTPVVSMELDSLTPVTSGRRVQTHQQLPSSRLQDHPTGTAQKTPATNADSPQDSTKGPVVVELTRALENDATDLTEEPDQSRDQQSTPGQSGNSQTAPLTNGQPVARPSANVMSLNFRPPANFVTPASYPDLLYPLLQEHQQQQVLAYAFGDPCINSVDPRCSLRLAHPTPASSRGDILGVGQTKSKDKSNKNGAVNKATALHLHVFGERRDEGAPTGVPTGRTSYHPDMPVYRLDLMNYPPVNPRQTCQTIPPSRRSQSAGAGRGIGLGMSSADFIEEACCSRHAALRDRQAPGSARLPDRMAGTAGGRRRSGSAGPAIEIRFGQQGEVILSSSRENRGQRTSR